MNLREIFFDMEKSPYLGWFYRSNKPQFINYNQIIQHDFIPSIQWQFEGEKKPSCYTMVDDLKHFKKDPTNDKLVVMKAAELIDQCDVMVIHNGKRFDWPEFLRKLKFHRLPAVRKPYIFDTLTESKKENNFSNSLKNVADYYGLTPKGENDSDPAKLIFGSIDERIIHIKKLAKYGLKDIAPMREYYHLSKGYSESVPHIKEGKGVCCCYCGGQNYQNRGETYLKGLNQFRNWYFCKSCQRKFPGEVHHRNV